MKTKSLPAVMPDPSAVKTITLELDAVTLAMLEVIAARNGCSVERQAKRSMARDLRTETMLTLDPLKFIREHLTEGWRAMHHNHLGDTDRYGCDKVIEIEEALLEADYLLKKLRPRATNTTPAPALARAAR